MWFDELMGYEGSVFDSEVDIRNAIPIGKYINELKYNLYKKNTGELKPIGIVDADGVLFIINGRNRAKANYDKGKYILPAKIMKSNSCDLGDFLLSISFHTLDDLPILSREQRQKHR